MPQWKEAEVHEDQSGCPQVWGKEAALGWGLRAGDGASLHSCRAAPGMASPSRFPGNVISRSANVPLSEGGDGAAGEGSVEGPRVWEQGSGLAKRDREAPRGFVQG